MCRSSDNTILQFPYGTEPRCLASDLHMSPGVPPAHTLTHRVTSSPTHRLVVSSTHLPTDSLTHVWTTTPAHSSTYRPTRTLAKTQSLTQLTIHSLTHYVVTTGRVILTYPRENAMLYKTAICEKGLSPRQNNRCL
jgi:hypothetical protein